LCIAKPSENNKSELSLDWVTFVIVKMRNISHEIIQQEILCRIVSVVDVSNACVSIFTDKNENLYSIRNLNYRLSIGRTGRN